MVFAECKTSMMIKVSVITIHPQAVWHTLSQYPFMCTCVCVCGCQPGELDVERLRAELEQQLHTWTPTQPGSQQEASEAWQRYEALTASLSQDLCEQLRLVLEPTQAAKLK